MPVINKPDLIAEIAEEMNKPKAEIERFINVFQDSVMQHVSEGREVKVSGFAAFSPGIRSARIMKNPRTGEDLEAPEKRTVRIHPLKKFRDKMAEDKEN
jgi:nucleoid DNA-binding protein